MIMDQEENEPEEAPLNKYEQESIDNTKALAALKVKFEKELRTETRYQQYFKGFNDASIESFIKTYAASKAIWHLYSASYVKNMEEREMRWINEASEHLKVIQQKKMFDAQCLWRAEKVTFDEIEILYDFMCWESNVLNCPFIDPIDENDIELYQAYLMQTNTDPEMDLGESWQDYSEIKEAYNTNNENRNFPEWYDFYNGRKGTGAYMLLPDIRGEKEQKYEDLALQKSAEENKQRNEEWEANRDKRPFINAYEDETLEFFIKTFEDKDTQLFYKAYSSELQDDGGENDVSGLISFLSEATEPIPIESHHDWREAIRKAADLYHAKKIAEFMPAAFEKYQLHQSLGIAHPEGKHFYQDVRNTYYNRILEGRELAGEPRDFNFWSARLSAN